MASPSLRDGNQGAVPPVGYKFEIMSHQTTQFALPDFNYFLPKLQFTLVYFEKTANQNIFDVAPMLIYV